VTGAGAMPRRLALAGLAIGVAGPAAAQMPGHAHGSPETPASRGYMAAMQRMQRDMAMPMSGDADRDFLAMMIPHHQSAIDMARVALEHARDPEVRRLAEAIIRDQAREIDEMKAMLARLPKG
jgi:uncharacterized protein (DUF305 family)